jgi:hypothetical protein
LQNGTNTDDLNPKPGGNYADNSSHSQCVRQNGKYFIDITINTAVSVTSPTYLVTVRWIPVGSGALAQSQLYYRF